MEDRFPHKIRLFEWMVMPFGLTNSLAAFQRFMNNILGDMLDICVVVYLDDILIYSDNLKEHKEHVQELLCHLWKHGLFAKASKCKWHKYSVEFLGYILLNQGLTMYGQRQSEDYPGLA
jgi:hypothetical protein